VHGASSMFFDNNKPMVNDRDPVLCPCGKNRVSLDKQDRIKGRTGIVYFSGYWARDTDSHGQTTGDHIDLWNKDTLSSPGLAGRVTSFFRFRMGLSRAWYSDLGKSKEILFWEIK
jgi:hypothetical protein